MISNDLDDQRMYTLRSSRSFGGSIYKTKNPGKHVDLVGDLESAEILKRAKSTRVVMNKRKIKYQL